MLNPNLDDDVNQWSEVLSGVAVNAIPYNYIDSITISFNNNKSWNIEIDTNTATDDDLLKFENTVSEMLYNYKNYINDIDFGINVLKVKTDIETLTNQFLTECEL